MKLVSLSILLTIWLTLKQCNSTCQVTIEQTRKKGIMGAKQTVTKKHCPHAWFPDCDDGTQYHIYGQSLTLRCVCKGSSCDTHPLTTTHPLLQLACEEGQCVFHSCKKGHEPATRRGVFHSCVCPPGKITVEPSGNCELCTDAQCMHTELAASGNVKEMKCVSGTCIIHSCDTNYGVGENGRCEPIVATALAHAEYENDYSFYADALHDILANEELELAEEIMTKDKEQMQQRRKHHHLRKHHQRNNMKSKKFHRFH